MARFFFDTHDGSATLTDAEGLEVADLHAACVEAVKTLPQIAKDALPDGNEKQFVIWVRDEGGHCVLAATLTLKVEKL